MMLTVVCDAKTGEVVFTYPNLQLSAGDSIDFDGEEYVVLEKQFHVKTGTICLKVVKHERTNME